jgi:stage IV sporulation protein FB
MRIHYSVLIVLIFALYTRTIIEFGIFFGCIILHEIGHLFFIKLFKQKLQRINLTIFGGQLDCYIGNVGQLKSILINSGGIIVNAILIYLANFFDGYYQKVLINYNFLLILFNILPIYPLDGYRILESLFSNTNVSFTFAVMSVISIIFIIALGIYSITLNSGGLIVIVIFLLIKNIERIKKKDHIILQKFIKQFS